MKSILFKASMIVMATSFIGCATQKHFSRIYPGMTAEQVTKEMKKGPDKTNLFQEDYSAWYYGTDRCLLMKQGVVVSKNQTEEKRNVEVIVPQAGGSGFGGYKEEIKAECIPPGVASNATTERTIMTPWGSIQTK